MRILSHYKKFTLLISFIVLLSFGLAACGGENKGSIKSPYKQVGGSGKSADGGEYAERMDDIEQRIDIIETDLRTLKPSIENLVAIEGDIQDLVKELATLTGEKSALQDEMQQSALQQNALPKNLFPENTQDNIPAPAPTPSPYKATPTPTPSPTLAPNMNPDLISEANPEPLPHARVKDTIPPMNDTGKATAAPTPLKNIDNTSVAASTPPPPAPVAPTPTNTSSSVTEMRVAAHSPNKVRLAMDFKPGDDIKYDIQQEGSDVVLVMPQTSWNALKDWTSTKTPLISKYAASSTNDGSKLSISTKGDDLTVKVFTLGPVKPGAGPRLVIDFEKGA